VKPPEAAALGRVLSALSMVTLIEGMRMLARDAKLIAEPAASIGIGALLASGLKGTPREKVCVVLTGGNWDLCDLADVYRDSD